MPSVRDYRRSFLAAFASLLLAGACADGPPIPGSPSVPSSPTTPIPTPQPSPSPQPPAQPPIAPLQDGVTIQGFEKYQYFALLYDTVPVRAMLARNGSTTDCTSTAKWTTANTDIALYISFPARGIYGRRVGTTDLTAECDGIKGTQSVTFGRYLIDGRVVDDSGAPVLGFHLTYPMYPYDFEGEYALLPGRFVIGSVTAQRVPLTFYKAGYDSQIFNLDWDFTPTTRPIVTLRRVGVPLVDEMIRGGKEYEISITTHSLLRVEAEVFHDSYYDGRLVSELFDGDQLVASKTFVRDSALPKLQRLIEIPLTKGTYRLRFRDLQASLAMITVTRIDAEGIVF